MPGQGGDWDEGWPGIRIWWILESGGHAAGAGDVIMRPVQGQQVGLGLGRSRAEEVHGRAHGARTAPTAGSRQGSQTCTGTPCAASLQRQPTRSSFLFVKLVSVQPYLLFALNKTLLSVLYVWGEKVILTIYSLQLP